MTNKIKLNENSFMGYYIKVYVAKVRKKFNFQKFYKIALVKKKFQ